MKELLIKLQDYTIKKYGEKGSIVELTELSNELHFGLCGVVEDMAFDGLLNIDQEQELYDFIESNMPYYDGNYGWKPGLLKPRLEWLKSQISIQN